MNPIQIEELELERIPAEIISIPKLTRDEQKLYYFHNVILGNKHVTPAYVMRNRERLSKGYDFFASSNKSISDSELENLADSELDF